MPGVKFLGGRRRVKWDRRKISLMGDQVQFFPQCVTITSRQMECEETLFRSIWTKKD